MSFPQHYEANASLEKQVIMPYKPDGKQEQSNAWQKVEQKKKAPVFWTGPLIHRFMGQYRAYEKQQQRDEAQEAFKTFTEQEN